LLPGPLEQVAHPRHPHEHLHELGAGDAEEGHPRLAGHRLGHERLAGARRADHEHALGDASAQLDELVGFLEELDHFLQLQLGLFRPGHVLEGDDREFGLLVFLGRS